MTATHLHVHISLVHTHTYVGGMPLLTYLNFFTLAARTSEDCKAGEGVHACVRACVYRNDRKQKS